MTFFNSSSAASQAYPLYLSVGLHSTEALLSSSNLHVLALLPSYSDLRHPHCGTDQHATNRCLLVWRALSHVLGELLELSPIEEDTESFLFLGHYDVGGIGVDRPTYAVPLLWLAGSHFLLACCVRVPTLFQYTFLTPNRFEGVAQVARCQALPQLLDEDVRIARATKAA